MKRKESGYSSCDSSFEDTSYKTTTSEVKFKHINRKFIRAKLRTFSVTIMSGNGYVNATHICGKCDKSFKYWIRDKHVKKLISTTKSMSTEADIIVRVAKGELKTHGFYIHPNLAHHLVYWCNPKYAPYMSHIVGEYHVTQVTREKDALLSKKQDKIARLSTTNKSIRKINRRLIKQNDILLNDDDDISDKHDDLVIQNDTASIYVLAIIKTNCKKKKKKTNPQYGYLVLRVQLRSYETRMKAIIKEYPNQNVLMKLNCTSRLVDIWNRIRYILSENISVKYNKFNLNKGYTEDMLLHDVKYIHHKYTIHRLA